MFDTFLKTAREIREDAKKQNRLIENPSPEKLRELFLKEPEARTTKYGSLSIDTEPTSRAAKFTKNNIDEKFGPDEEALLKQAKERLAKEQLVSFDVIVGDGSEGITARLIAPGSGAERLSTPR